MNLNGSLEAKKLLRSDLESFAAGFSRHVPGIVEIFKSAQFQKLRERAELKRDLLAEYEDKRDTDQLTAVIDSDPDLTAEDKERLLTSIPAHKTGLRVGSKEQRDRIQRAYDDLKARKAKLADREVETAAKAGDVRAEFEAQKRRIPKGEQERFAPYLQLTEPTAADVAALKDDLKLYHDDRRAGSSRSAGERKAEVRRQLVAMGGNDMTLVRGFEVARETDPDLFQEAVGLGIRPDKSGSSAGARRSQEPKSAKELLEKAYSDWSERRKDADELALVSRMVGVEAPAGQSFREYLESDWLPNVGKVFNPEVADSMISALRGAPAAAGKTAKPASGGGEKVPDDLVRRAYEALDRIEKQIQELEARN